MIMTEMGDIVESMKTTLDKECDGHIKTK